MPTQRFFSVRDGNKEVVKVSLLTGAALEWNEDRQKRVVFQVAPDENGGWTVIRQITSEELLGALGGGDTTSELAFKVCE